MPGHADQQQITSVLDEFQRGYIERDVTVVDSYVKELFAEDALVIGTGLNEWCDGIEEVKKLVKDDWETWGDLRIDTSKAISRIEGDTAWIAVAGTLSNRSESASEVDEAATNGVYPIRVAASLVRQEGEWKFKQMVFSYPYPRKFIAAGARRQSP